MSDDQFRFARPDERSGSKTDNRQRAEDIDILESITARSTNGARSGTAGYSDRAARPIQVSRQELYRGHPPVRAPRYRKNSKRKNWPLIISYFAIIIIVCAGLIWVFTTRTLAIRRVEITGVPPATAIWVHKILPIDPLNRNLPSFLVMDSLKLRHKVTALHPSFASTSVGFRLRGTLVIHIVQRQPYALLSSGPNLSWVLDARGIPILPGKGHPSRLIKILLGKPAPGQQPFRAELGKPLPPNVSDCVQSAYTVMAVLRQYHSPLNVNLILVDNPLNVGLNVNSGLHVILGDTSNLPAKLHQVEMLLTQKPEWNQTLQYLDVSYPSRPAELPKQLSPSNADRLTLAQ